MSSILFYVFLKGRGQGEWLGTGTIRLFLVLMGEKIVTEKTNNIFKG